MFIKLTSQTKARAMRGLTLIELIAFVVIVGAGVAGILSVYQNIAATSADPMIRKQQLAIAESLLTEIKQQPFTYCDVADPQFETATSAGVALNRCSETKYDEDNFGDTGPRSLKAGRAAFDNVGNYAGQRFANLGDLSGNAAVDGYSANVTIQQVGGTAPFQTIPLADALKIEVSVTGQAALSQAITLVGYRTRYAPKSP